MMSKRAEMPQSRRHVLVFDEDWEWLEDNYGRYSTSRIGTGVAVRKILHAHIRQLKQVVQDNLDRRASSVEATAEMETIDA
jgi:hypothetical protein